MWVCLCPETMEGGHLSCLDVKESKKNSPVPWFRQLTRQNKASKKRKKNRTTLPSVADYSVVVAAAVRASCAWSSLLGAGSCCCVLYCAFSPLRFCNTILGRVGSGQRNTYRGKNTKKTHYSAMTAMAMAAAIRNSPHHRY